VPTTPVKFGRTCERVNLYLAANGQRPGGAGSSS
jgi:hypothetical protein